MDAGGVIHAAVKWQSLLDFDLIRQQRGWGWWWSDTRWWSGGGVIRGLSAARARNDGGAGNGDGGPSSDLPPSRSYKPTLHALPNHWSFGRNRYFNRCPSSCDEASIILSFNKYYSYQ